MKIGTIGTGSIVATMIENMQRTILMSRQFTPAKKKLPAKWLDILVKARKSAEMCF